MFWILKFNFPPIFCSHWALSPRSLAILCYQVSPMLDQRLRPKSLLTLIQSTQHRTLNFWKSRVFLCKDECTFKVHRFKTIPGVLSRKRQFVEPLCVSLEDFLSFPQLPVRPFPFSSSIHRSSLSFFFLTPPIKSSPFLNHFCALHIFFELPVKSD